MLSENKRKFPRVNYPCSLTIWQGSGYDTIMTNTSNLGAGGILVHINQGMMIGAKVEIKIDCLKEASFECNGLVLRCHQNRESMEDSGETYSVAIAFEGLDEKRALQLKEVIEKFLNSESAN